MADDVSDKLLNLIPVAITAKIVQGFIPDNKPKKNKKSIFDFK